MASHTMKTQQGPFRWFATLVLGMLVNGWFLPVTAEDSCPSTLVECGIYMAPSTLGNYTNLGMFTAKPLTAGTVLPFPEIAIPLLFRDWDEHPPYAYGDGTLWDRYIWDGGVANLERFWDNALQRWVRRSVFVPGLGCTVNSQLDLNNIKSTSGSVYDTATVDRGNPAAGSFTPYHSSVTRTVRDIPAGTELLASYGEAWIPWIPDVAVTQDEHMDAADTFLKEVWTWVQDMAAKHGPEQLTVELLERLWKMTVEFPHSSPTLSVLPKTVDWKTLLDQVQQESLRLSTRGYWRKQQQVSIDWLKRYGKCQDHLKPGISTIPNAGRGAFANRNLPKGTVVGYAPLIHVGERFLEFATIPYYPNPSQSARPHYSKPDLVINYSFGHANSTLLLTPYGAMVNYINHSPERANVRVQWSQPPSGNPNDEMVAHKPEWLTKDVPFLRDTTSKIGLSFDYIALRDIQEGEEVFLDYGPEWQAAWDEHVATWKPPPDAENYVHSSQYEIDQLKTPEEQELDPYPSNLVTQCRKSYRKENSPSPRFTFLSVLRLSEEWVPCQVLSREADGRYTVQMTISPSTTASEWASPGEVPTKTITVHQVPRPHGIQLFDKAYSQDWHLQQAFRHKLYIPNDVFPEKWKNLQ